MHLAGLAGIATDIAYQPGSAAFGRIRTAVINQLLRLCGSRFGRGWIRPGGVRYPVREEAMPGDPGDARAGAAGRPGHRGLDVQRALGSIQAGDHRENKAGKPRTRSASPVSSGGRPASTRTCGGICLSVTTSTWTMSRAYLTAGDSWARTVLRMRGDREVAGSARTDAPGASRRRGRSRAGGAAGAAPARDLRRRGMARGGRALRHYRGTGRSGALQDQGPVLPQLAGPGHGPAGKRDLRLPALQQEP